MHTFNFNYLFNYLLIKKNAACGGERLASLRESTVKPAVRHVLRLIIREGLFNFLLRCRDYWWLTRPLGRFKWP